MMNRLFARIRIPTVIATVLALVVTGIAAGAAGGYLVLGQANDSGTSQTVLQNAGLGAAFTLKTTNQSTGATGIFGWSSSAAGNATKGVYGKADGPNSYGVYGVNNGVAGSGAAVYADGGANPGLIVNVDSNGVDPIKVNSTGLVDNLNADMLDYFHANQLGRVAFASTANYPGDGASGTVLTVNINAPVRGYFSVVASVDSFNFTGNGAFGCQINIDDNYIVGTQRFVSLVDNANEDQDCSTNGAVSTCGGDATFTFVTTSVDVGTNFAAASMHVIFTPFNGTGGQPSLIGCVVISLEPATRELQ